MTPERTKEEILNIAAEQYKKEVCKQDDKNTDYLFTWDEIKRYCEKDFKAGAKWQESQCSPVESKWVSVKTRLPEDGKLVLAYGDGIMKIVQRQKGSKGWHSRRLTTYWLLDAFTHWQPLPELPSPTIEETKEK